MVSVGTYLSVVDNSGGIRVQCLKILGGNSKSYGSVGSIVIVSVKQALPSKKIKKGGIYKGIIVSVKKNKIRFNGDLVNFEINGVVLVNDKEVPLGTRILVPVMLELRKKSFMKIISMAPVTI